ncbi:MAG: glycosyltransferase [Bacteroidales bacterium]|nr:glycosyltransferase [Bacteroidales bacterium]
MKKVLIITYYWPPAGGGGVQRITKFCKYLSNHGWEPHVITISQGSYQAVDYSMVNDINGIKVYYTDVKTVGNVVNPRINGSNNEQSIQKSSSKLKNFIRVNFLIPDAKILWYWSALKKAKEVIANEKIDLIYSTSPPYTVQLVAKKLKKLTGLSWIVDFRDPWVENIYYNNVFRFTISKYINRKMEKSVLSDADEVITVGNYLKHLLEKKTSHNVAVIHNGYDHSDFPNGITKSDKFIIGYYGSLNSKQISNGFFELLSNFKHTKPELYRDFELHLAGNHTSESINSIEKYIPTKKIINFGYLSHQKLLVEQCKEQLLIQFIHEQKDNEVIIGSKIYEYFHTGNPILCLGNKQCEAAILIDETQTGVTFHYEELDKIKNYIELMYSSWQDGHLNDGKKNFPEYERKNQVKQLVELFNKVVND